MDLSIIGLSLSNRAMQTASMALYDFAEAGDPAYVQTRTIVMEGGAVEGEYIEFEPES